jgi:ABC-2 type transport system permease protein
MFMSMFPALQSDIGSTMKILETLPAAVRQGLGISLNDFFTIFGFYSYEFSFVVLAGSIQAMNVGVGIISKEMSGKTADFLLTKPVSRSSVVVQKLLAGLAALVFTNVVFIAVALAAATVASKDSFSVATFLLLNATLFFVQLFFLVLGMLLAILARKIKSVIAVSLPVTFGFFIVGSLGAIIGNTAVRYVTPFKFYDSGYIVHHRGYEPKYLLVEAGFITAALIASFVIFNKKEVPSA